MIETFDAILPHGITLSCRATGPIGAPLLVFLHGFPEAAFVWDEVMARFGDRYRCVAPNLRGFGPSSSPSFSVSMAFCAEPWIRSLPRSFPTMFE